MEINPTSKEAALLQDQLKLCKIVVGFAFLSHTHYSLISSGQTWMSLSSPHSDINLPRNLEYWVILSVLFPKFQILSLQTKIIYNSMPAYICIYGNYLQNILPSVYHSKLQIYSQVYILSLCRVYNSHLYLAKHILCNSVLVVRLLKVQNRRIQNGNGFNAGFWEATTVGTRIF